MNAVIYARYSSDNQREESIEGQLRECKAFAEKNYIQIVGTYIVRGLTESAYKCKFNGGTLPLGYTIDSEQHFQIDPLVAPAVLEAFKRYAEGASMTEIAQEMNAKGLRSAFGGKIGVDMVTRMLKNRRYIGEFKYRDIVHPHGIPAIIPDELFDRVQRRMATNKKAPAKHKAEDEYLLTTKLRCGKCECFMVGESGTSKTSTVYRYYKCVGVKKHSGCDRKTVKKDWIEDLVVKQIEKVLYDDVLIEKIADTIMKIQGKENTVLPMLRKQYADIQRGIDNLLNAIQQGIVTPLPSNALKIWKSKRVTFPFKLLKRKCQSRCLLKTKFYFGFIVSANTILAV